LFIEKAQRITERTDIWSLGCVLIELFASPSAIPWQRLDDLAIAKRVTAADQRLSVPPEVRPNSLLAVSAFATYLFDPPALLSPG
jgi:serine/threonine protein kinase